MSVSSKINKSFQQSRSLPRSVTSQESPVVSQQQVIPRGPGDVEFTDRRETSASEAQAYGAAAEMLQGARPGAPPTHQVEERPVLLRGQTETPKTSGCWTGRERERETGGT